MSTMMNVTAGVSVSPAPRRNGLARYMFSRNANTYGSCRTCAAPARRAQATLIAKARAAAARDASRQETHTVVRPRPEVFQFPSFAGGMIGNRDDGVFCGEQVRLRLRLRLRLRNRARNRNLNRNPNRNLSPRVPYPAISSPAHPHTTHTPLYPASPLRWRR